VTGRLFDYTTGSVVQESLPSSETTDYSYDDWKRLTTVKNDNAKTVRTHAYSLGSNSNYILTKDMLNVTASASSNVKQWFDGLADRWKPWIWEQVHQARTW
jgi:YD repeat-containing protein